MRNRFASFVFVLGSVSFSNVTSAQFGFETPPPIATSGSETSFVAIDRPRFRFGFELTGGRAWLDHDSYAQVERIPMGGGALDLGLQATDAFAVYLRTVLVLGEREDEVDTYAEIESSLLLASDVTIRDHLLLGVGVGPAFLYDLGLAISARVAGIVSRARSERQPTHRHGFLIGAETQGYFAQYERNLVVLFSVGYVMH